MVEDFTCNAQIAKTFQKCHFSGRQQKVKPIEPHHIDIYLCIYHYPLHPYLQEAFRNRQDLWKNRCRQTDR